MTDEHDEADTIEQALRDARACLVLERDPAYALDKINEALAALAATKDKR